ncbi:hypothetical protein CF335_g7914 [Tilletia laevis]|nr:hypothetical protein CF335_g7914 [Tilletia laevis]
MEASGFPLRQLDVEASAYGLVQARWRRSTPPESLGIHWFSRFIERHCNLLSFKTKASLSRDRTRGLTKANAAYFYHLLNSLQQQYNFEPSSVLSMDETGVQHGVASRSFKYAVSSQPRGQTAAAKKDGSQELTTVIETIAADGTSLPPVYVFKGKMVNLSLAFEEKLGGFITGSESGWTNIQIAQQWFERVFLPGKKVSAPETAADNTSTVSADAGAGEAALPEPEPTPRLLIMDGHTSHFTLQVMLKARAANVHILALPAHTTHGLAPLDRTCFGPLKQAWAEAQRTEMMLTSVVRKEDVIRLYQTAREQAFTVGNIQKGYEATGIWPYNPNAIPESMFFYADALGGGARGDERRRADVERPRGSAFLFAAMKAKPRAFRVAQDGGARLYTSDESIGIMRAAQEAKIAEQQRKDAAAEEREERREAREREEEEKRQRQAVLKVARDRKRLEEAAAKEKRKEERLERKRAREAVEAEKELRKKRKIDALLARSDPTPLSEAPSNQQL